MRARSTDTVLLVVDREVWEGSTELVPWPPGICPDCMAVLDVEVVAVDALFYDCGYGATAVSKRRHCRCGYTLLFEVSEEKPPGRRWWL